MAGQLRRLQVGAGTEVWRTDAKGVEHARVQGPGVSTRADAGGHGR